MKKYRITLCLALAAVFSGCSDPWPSDKAVSTSPENVIVAEVGDRKITLKDLDREYERYKTLISGEKKDARGLEQRIRTSLLGRMVDNAALELEASRLGVTVPSEKLDARIKELLGDYDEARLGLVLAENNVDFGTWKKELTNRLKIEALIENEVNSKVEISEDEIKGYYEENKDQFVWPQRVHVLQIMVNDETTAEQTRKKLLLKESDFATIARDLSQSPDAANGGDLGFVSQGQLPPEFESAVFRLKPGEMSEVVKSIYGFHIFKAAEIESSRAMSYPEAKDRIRKILLAPKREEAFRNWLDQLKKETRIKVYPSRFAASPLS